MGLSRKQLKQQTMIDRLPIITAENEELTRKLESLQLVFIDLFTGTSADLYQHFLAWDL